MKTRFFQNKYLSDEGKNNLKSLVKLNEETKRIIIDWFKNLDTYPLYTSDIFEMLTSKTNENRKTIQKAVSITDYFLRGLGEYDDNLNDLIEDIRTDEFFDKTEEYDFLREYLKELEPIKSRYFFYSRIDDVEGFAVPSLIAATRTVAIKPVFEKGFKYGKDNLSNYFPEPIFYVPVGQIQLETNNDETFSFQINTKVLDRFISELLALQAEMKQVNKDLEKIKKLHNE